MQGRNLRDSNHGGSDLPTVGIGKHRDANANQNVKARLVDRQIELQSEDGRHVSKLWNLPERDPELDPSILLMGEALVKYIKDPIYVTVTDTYEFSLSE